MVLQIARSSISDHLCAEGTCSRAMHGCLCRLVPDTRHLLLRHVLPTLFLPDTIFHPIPKEGVKDKVQELEVRMQSDSVVTLINCFMKRQQHGSRSYICSSNFTFFACQDQDAFVGRASVHSA